MSLSRVHSVRSPLVLALPAALTLGSPFQAFAADTPQGGTPPGCVATSLTVQGPGVTIPPSGTVTSTIALAGVDPYLWDLDVQTFITHAFPTDLDITLTSPAGTVSTLTTDNGGVSANVFNGTLWDDSGGETNPPGPPTDTTYAANVVETPLALEEAMGAFVGEDPNGTWTLTITDDFNPDGGNLASGSMTFDTFAAPPTPGAPAAFTNNTPTPIPDVTTVTSTITVSGVQGFCDIDMTTFIAHTFPGDLDITLTSPAGTVSTITTDNGSGAINALNGTIWDDDGGTANPPGAVTDTTFAANVVEATLVPEEAMGAFLGEDPNGVWTITITDDAGGDTGTLTSWTLNFAACSCVGACQLTCPADVVQANDAGICGAVVNYPAPVPTGQCGTVTCTPPSGGLFDVGTTGVTCASSTGSPQAATHSSGDIAARIPEAGTAGNMVPVVLSVPPGGTVVDVDVRIRANHTFDGDLSIAMLGPDGVTTVSLAENRGGGGDNFGTGATDCSGTKTVFDDEAGTPIGAGSAPFAGSFMPETALSAFDGLPSGGDWTLTIVDEVGGDSGFLYCLDIVLTALTPDGICTFNVTVNDVEPPVLTCPADIVQDLPPGVPSEPVAFGDPGVTDNCPNPGAPSCVPPSGSIFTVGTTPVACTALDAAGNTGSCTFDVTLNAVSILEIPTASTWGLAALALLLAGLGLSLLRRRTIGTR
jgi:subtilisin-like proprotein convertase family protein